MGIALSALPSARNHDSFPWGFKIREKLPRARVSNHGPYRHRDDLALSPPSVLILASAVLPSTGVVLFLVAQIKQGCELRIRDDHYVSSISSIASVRTAARHVFFPPEAHAPAPAVTSLHFNPDLINKFHTARLKNPFSISPKYHHPFSIDKKKAPKGAFPPGWGKKLNRKHAHPLSLFVQPLVTDHPIDFGEEGIIPAHADIPSRVDARPELTNNNISRAHVFAAEDLNSPSLPLTVPPVTRAPTCFFMSHIFTPLPNPESP